MGRGRGGRGTVRGGAGFFGRNTTTRPPGAPGGPHKLLGAEPRPARRQHKTTNRRSFLFLGFLLAVREMDLLWGGALFAKPCSSNLDPRILRKVCVGQCACVPPHLHGTQCASLHSYAVARGALGVDIWALGMTFISVLFWAKVAAGSLLFAQGCSLLAFLHGAARSPRRFRGSCVRRGCSLTGHAQGADKETCAWSDMSRVAVRSTQAQMRGG